MRTPRPAHTSTTLRSSVPPSPRTFIKPDNLTPRKNGRWKSTKRMTTGSIVSTTPAISGAQECEYSDTNRFSPNASVYLRDHAADDSGHGDDCCIEIKLPERDYGE